jgi:hypothetical protein
VTVDGECADPLGGFFEFEGVYDDTPLYTETADYCVWTVRKLYFYPPNKYHLLLLYERSTGKWYARLSFVNNPIYSYGGTETIGIYTCCLDVTEFVDCIGGELVGTFDLLDTCPTTTCTGVATVTLT